MTTSRRKFVRTARKVAPIAQVLHHIKAVLSSGSATVGGAVPTITVTAWQDAGETRPFTARPLALSYVSNTPATATIGSSSGTIALVAAGTDTFTVTDTISGKTATTGTLTVSAAGTVTSVTLFYAGAQPTNNMFMRSGQTYTLVAKDQVGNVLDGSVGSWSSNHTSAPINASTGVVSPSTSAIIAATFTYTHTASGHTGTVSANAFPAVTVLKSDVATNYGGSNTSLFANIWGNIVSSVRYAFTGTSGSLYTDGVKGDLITIDTSSAGRLHGIGDTFLKYYPASDVTYGADNYGILRASFANKKRAWVLVAKRYAPSGESRTNTVNDTVSTTGYTTTGTQGGGSPADKDGPFFGMSNYNGRMGVGYLSADIYGDDTTNDSSLVGTGTFPDQNLAHSDADEWTAGKWYPVLFLYEWKSNNIASYRVWKWPLGNAPAQLYQRVEAYAIEGKQPPIVYNISPFGENYNQARGPGQNLFKNVGLWEVVDGETYGDPYGVLGTQPTQTVTSIDVSSVAHGTASQAIVFTGTGFNENCNPVFSNPGVRVLTLTYTSSTSITATIAVTSTATTGAGTVVMHNNASGTDSGAVAFTVT